MLYAGMKDRKCPKCGDTNISMPTGDGNILALCGHVWKDTECEPTDSSDGATVAPDTIPR